MKFSSIQPYLVLVTCIITSCVTIVVFFLTRSSNRDIETLKYNLQLQQNKQTETFKTSLNKDLETFKADLQMSVVKETEPFKASITKDIEGLKSGFQLDLIRETEPLKASLNKNNIAFQIHSAEFLKMRFQKINELFTAILSLHDYLNRSKLIADHESGAGSEGYSEKFKEKMRHCEEKIDIIYNKSYDASLYFDNPIRPDVEKYVLVARRVILYSMLQVEVIQINNFKIGQPGYVFSKGLFEEDEEKKKANRHEEVILGKRYLTESQTIYNDHLKYKDEVDRRLTREEKDLQNTFSKLENRFRLQLISTAF